MDELDIVYFTVYQGGLLNGDSHATCKTNAELSLADFDTEFPGSSFAPSVRMWAKAYSATLATGGTRAQANTAATTAVSDHASSFNTLYNRRS